MRSIFKPFDYHPYVWEDFLYINQGLCIHILQNLVRKKGPKFLCFCGSLVEVHRGVYTVESLEIGPQTILCSTCAFQLPGFYLNSHLKTLHGLPEEEILLRMSIHPGFIRLGYLDYGRKS